MKLENYNHNNMGSSASVPPVQPASPSISPSKSPSIKRQKSKVIAPPKPKQPQQHIIIKPAIAQVVIKQATIPRQLSSQKTSQIQQIKKTGLIEFQNRFLLKVSKKQIRLIFKPTQMQNPSLLSSSLHNSSLKSLDRRCLNDLQIYREICDMKMKCLLTQHLKNVQESSQAFNNVKQLVKKEFDRTITELLGQIQGKTSIWHSLNLTQKQIVTNLINFLHEEGIDSSNFDIIKQKEPILSQI